jgi:uncharacterized protein
MFRIIDIETGRFGKKVTSNKAIAKGTVIIRFTGKPITFAESKTMGARESFALQTGYNSYILLDEPACLFNHSCEPNCGLTPELDLIAIEQINEGEELCYDYSTTMLERSWTMACQCNRKSCRKIIEDFDRLPAELQDKYISLKIVQEFILRALKRI